MIMAWPLTKEGNTVLVNFVTFCILTACQFLPPGAIGLSGTTRCAVMRCDVIFVCMGTSHPAVAACVLVTLLFVNLTESFNFMFTLTR